MAKTVNTDSFIADRWEDGHAGLIVALFGFAVLCWHHSNEQLLHKMQSTQEKINLSRKLL